MHARDGSGPARAARPRRAGVPVSAGGTAAAPPAAWFREPLLRHSALLIAASQAGNVCNLLFQVAMMRRLGTAEYGVLSALLALVLVVGAPSDALRTAVAHVTARLLRAGRPGELRPALAAWVRLVAVTAAALFAAVAAGSPWIAAYLRIDRSELVVLTALVMAASLFVPFVVGTLQGLERFGPVALLGQLPAAVRLGGGLALVVWAGAGAGGALAAQAAGLGVFLVAAWRVVPRALPPGAATGGERPAAAYFARSLLLLLAFGILMNADVSLVKHYFPPDQAGVYARAATMARAIVFLPAPIALALFPKVVSTGARSTEATRLLARAALYVAGLILAAATAGTLLAPWIWRAFTGAAPGPEAVPLLRCALWAMAPIGLVHLLMNFEMAQNRFAGPLALLPAAALYLAGVALHHGRLTDVLAVLAAVNVLAVAALAAGIRPARARPG